jgi:hypothetical protein
MTGPVSALTRANRVAGGRKAQATVKRQKDWRTRALASVEETMAAPIGRRAGASGRPPPVYEAPAIPELLARIRAHQGAADGQ